MGHGDRRSTVNEVYEVAIFLTIIYATACWVLGAKKLNFFFFLMECFDINTGGVSQAVARWGLGSRLFRLSCVRSCLMRSIEAEDFFYSENDFNIKT